MTQTVTDVRTYGHLIDGQEVHTASTVDRYSPETGQLLARFANGSVEDANAAVAAARRVFDTGTWPQLPAAERSKVLLAIAEVIRDNTERLARIDAEEVGKPLRLARGDLAPTIAHFEYAAALSYEVRGDAYTNFGPEYTGLITREPVGVVGLITPWNFPALSYGETVPYALATGCTVVLKPSEFTSGSALEITRLAKEVSLPDGVVNVATGAGDPVGQAIVEHPDVDHISFTGSTSTGQKIAAAAARGLKRVTLELGGKGATIVFADADLDEAVDGAVFAVFFNTGECCVAGSRLLIEDSVADEFVNRLVERARKLRVGALFDERTDIGALIHEQHRNKVLSYIDSANTAGARLLTGGGCVKGDLAAGLFVEPTIFDRVTPEMKIFQEEIFGPVLAVTRFSTVDEAIALANGTAYGLGNSIWTKNIDTALRMRAALRSGTVWINTTIDGPAQMTFGGVKTSGYGRKFGRAGLEEFTELKSCIIRQTGTRQPFFT